MASRGFIELLRIADLARARKSGRRGGKEFDWQGVVFEIGGQRLVAPMGQVSEILTMPEYTSVPLVKPWMLGIANIRGRLLPLTDLSRFLQVPSQLSQMSQRKVIVI
ncbi:MAG: chemotaxis protein CheW, partial [Psychrobacter sp.]|nr:chemotaxis protein CheW [Psychrobacter sp.]